MLRGLHHIALKATDFEKSRIFYTKLGLVPYREWGEGDGKVLMLKMDDGAILELFAGGSDDLKVMALWQHIALETDDTDAMFNAALNAGAKVKAAPFSVVIPSSPENMPVRIAFVYGPDGEEIEFFQHCKKQ